MEHDPFTDGAAPSEGPTIVDLIDGPIDRSELTPGRRRPRGRGGRVVRRGASVPAAVGGALLVCAIAFGAAGHLGGPSATSAGDGAAANAGGTTITAASEGGANGPDSRIGAGAGGDGATAGADLGTEPGSDQTAEPGATDGADPVDGDGPTTETPDTTPTAEPTREPEPTAKPTPKPEPTPERTAEPAPKPTPEIGSVGLTVTLTDAGKPRVDWGSCTGDWDLTKVVRSTNDGVTFPLGDGDSYAGVFGKDGPTAMTDGEVPAGKTIWYRVFCVRASGDGYVLVARSESRKITTPAAEPLPEPDPVTLDGAAHVTDGGAVALEWGTCSSEAFAGYKIVRSATENPSYLPATDGSVVLENRESATFTTFTDTSVEPGQTWFYRIQCIGWMNDHKILLGQTDVLSVTLPS